MNPESHVDTAENGLSFLCPPKLIEKESKDIASMIRIQRGTPTIPNQSAQNPDPAIGAIRSEVTMFATTCHPNV